MKAKRFLFHAPVIFGVPLKVGVPVFIGFSFAISGLTANAGDILRGGSTRSNKPARATGGTPTPAATDAARANAKDTLARTSKTLADIRNLQNAARNAAIRNSANNLGKNPNKPNVKLPNVPNGIAIGGLNPTADPTKWTGANKPVEIVRNGKTNVTIKQTTQQALLEWQTMNVGKNTTLTFDQKKGGADSGKWIAFNQIKDTSGNPTQILGNIKADGQVYMINTNGIIFGGSSQVNAKALTASSLPINTKLIERGLLNNPDTEFLFDGLGKGKMGDVTVQAGARITSPVGNDGNGGRVFLAGANVTNEGTISTPAGQTILAAGLQVGILAHASNDPSIRGLDVVVGAVTDPASTDAPYAGTATNSGIIESARGNVTITGKDVRQAGVIESSTSVSLNGSVNLLANYGATRNAGYRANDPATGSLFNFSASGTVTLAEGSLTRILPEYGSKDKVTGTELALRSRIDVQGKSIHMGKDAEIFAPNAKVSMKAGEWTALESGPFAAFLSTNGQVYLDTGARINLAGTVDAEASFLQNYLTVTLRGSELSVAPLQRDSVLRGNTIVVDITKTGTYNGNDWVGTPLADLRGYLGLIERDISQLTTAGGTLDISSGGSVVIRKGANVDVSGGWTNFTGGTVRTSRLITGDGRLIDIDEATPDQVYKGIFNGTSTFTSEKWGKSETFNLAIAPTGQIHQKDFLHGANAGGISITTPSLALDGDLKGTRVSGPRQVHSSGGSKLPSTGSLTIKLQAQLYSQQTQTIYTYTPTQPDVVFGTGEQKDVLDFNPDSLVLESEREGKIFLSESLVSDQGFGNLTIVNEGGDIVVPESVTLKPGTGSTFSLTGANIDVLGKIISPGSTLSFKALNLTTYEEALAVEFVPPANVGRGVLTLGASAVLDTSGGITDGRTLGEDSLEPVVLRGGTVNLIGYSADLKAGSKVDVSGGFLLDSSGRQTYGNGGTINIEAGVNPGAKALGGFLNLESTLAGYSGAKGGTLNIQAPHIQIGGSTTQADTLLLDPSYLNKGGFNTFKLTGLGIGDRPGVLVTSGTRITPVVKSLEAVVPPLGDGKISLGVIQKIPSERNAVNLTLSSPGVGDRNVRERGDVIIEEGAVIRTDPGGSVAVTGTVVSVLGSIISHGGTITVGGGRSTGVQDNPANAFVTTFIGSKARLDASGTVIRTPDDFGRKTGRVLAGGNITLTGNISASAGAVLDVSGTSASLDINPGTVIPTKSHPAYNGLNNIPLGIASDRVKVDTNGGRITLTGLESLSSNATLIGHAGGKTALGGSLVVSSGLFLPENTEAHPSQVNLTVTQTGTPATPGIRGIAEGSGRFVVDSLTGSGLDAVALEGVVLFDGDVTLKVNRELSVASNAFLHANGKTVLEAPHVVLGRPQEVVLPDQETAPFAKYSILPTHGTGSLEVNADLIDLGHLSFQQVGKITLNAGKGDIRGSGTVQSAGDLVLSAGHIYPNTASKLTFVNYDYQDGGVTREGSITVTGSGTKSLPLSAGGTLSLYASNIVQNGTLRAPFGTINLGWDGTGTRPVDILAGSAGGSSFPITKKLTLGSSSVTSVSAVDPLTGKGITIPYGVSTNGENWIDPRGVDITSTGVPQKNIILQGGELVTESGSLIDLKGGGDLYAYRWIEGLGGPSDILATTGGFAVIPGYSSDFAPVSEYNTSAYAETNPNLIAGYTGYTNSSLKVGDRIYLNGSKSLPAGFYTLLPARYALLPGAVLVTPTGGNSPESHEMPDKSSVVSGYRYNSLNAAQELPGVSTRFEIASSKVVRERAEYADFFASIFMKKAAHEGVSPLLPSQSGHLVFQAQQAMELSGSVASKSVANGRGSTIDISTTLDTVITSGNLNPTAGVIQLDSGILGSFGAESLLIGGRRTTTADGSTVTVTSGSVTVDNAGDTLAARDLIIVAKGGITLAEGSSLASTGKLSDAENLLVSGNGTLVRVSADKNASVSRSNITAAASPVLTIGSGARITGGGVILDSSAGVSLSADASISAKSYQFAAGNIAVLLKNPGTVAAGSGLVVSNSLLDNLQAASSLKLLSYGTIDLYGTGTFGSTKGLSSLSLSSGQIRGLNTDGGTARIAAGTVRLENSAAGASSVSNGASSGDLEFIANRIELGQNQVAINGYSSVLLDASDGVIGEGTGGLSVQGNLTVRTPVLAGAARANRTIAATGNVVLQGTSRDGSSPVASGLGSSLSVTGQSVTVNTRVALPSGSLKFNALSGDLTVKDELDVSGTTKKFHDVKKVTSGGNISLTAANGDVILTGASELDLSSPAAGGNGGNLSVSTPNGAFTLEGTILGSGGKGGNDGSFFLDVFSLPSLAALNQSLAASDLTEVQRIRVRSGDVLVNGTATARDFGLTVDQGDIRVTGTVDASGKTGGEIRLAAHGGITLEDGSLLTVAGEDFSNAGKGGSITLESGSSLNGVAGTGSVSILEGSTLDLSVASKVEGSASTPGSSAYLGKFSGKLHIRAPRTSGNNDLLVGTLAGTIIDASSILVEGYKVYDLTSSGGAITSTVQTSIRTDANGFLGAAGATIANYTNITNRLLAANPDLAGSLVLAPGVEIVNRTGDLVLGTSSSTTSSDWNLSTFRFGAKSAAGVLTLRSAGDLVFHNALSDGFSPTLANTDASWLWTARLAARNPLLPQNEQSWSYRLTAGADFSAADFGAVVPSSSLAAGKGTLKLGKNATNQSTTNGANATTLSAITNRYQVIRTGSGDIDINTARDVQFLNQFATIYTAGTAVADPTLGGLFKVPSLASVNSTALGAAQQDYAVQYSSAGGNVEIHAGGNIERLTLLNGQLVADSQLQMPTNWLYKRGYVGTDGLFGADREGTSTSTTWWVDFSNFFQGVGALGGGDVTVTAGNNISNVDVVIPTNARMPGYADSSQTQRIGPDASRLIEIGGGDLTVRASNNIDAGVYYVERGDGVLSAGGSFVTNATRSVMSPSSASQASIYTQLPTTLFLGKGTFDVSANGDLLLGPVANPFLLPGGQLNGYLNKSYFSTYDEDNEVTVSSLGGTVTLKTTASQAGGGFEEPILWLYYRNKLLFNGSTTSVPSRKPWLRLSERDMTPFSSLFALQPASVSAVSFSGDVNLAGGLVLSPSPRGNVSILAAGSINALQPSGVGIADGVTTTYWGNATINLSDANPAAIPGIANPFGYQGIGGTGVNASQTQAGFLDFIKALFLESGDTLGANVTLLTKQLLHGAGPLHSGDTEPLRLYAGDGDISGLTLFSPKFSRVIAGRDISDISFYIQNLSGNDTSIVSSGRDILPYTTLSSLRQLASTGGNAISVSSGTPRDGDIQISGPGTLEVLAGRNLDLGIGPNNPAGTGVGITSVGNTRNPYLPDEGANLVIGAGLGLSEGLAGSKLHIREFIDNYVRTKEGAKYLKEIAPDADFDALGSEEQARLAVEVFYRVLRDAGREYLKTGKKKSYKPANEAIEVLFGKDADEWVGEILTRSRDIRTANGGDISMLTPGGGITLASSTTGSTLAPPGIVTAGGGNIGIFARQSVNIGIGRIFTLRGGDEIIWSTKGDIAAGSSSKTVQTASPTRVRIDPQSAAVQTDLSGLATGGGIGVLNTVKGVEPGDVDLIAPEGTVDAGDAGIRVSGNLNIAANQVLNAANISVSGSSSGASAPSVSSPSVRGLTAASNSAATTTNSATIPANEPPREQTVETTDAPSIITVEVIGYGGGSDDEEDEENPSSSDQSQ